MIAGFKSQFKPKLLSGQKIHTIRRGHRWREGLMVQMATGVRTKKYDNFKTLPCTGVERIEITYWESDLIVVVGGYTLTMVERVHLATNDGFDDYHEFVKWFCDATGKGSEIFKGQIIHWTEFRYT